LVAGGLSDKQIAKQLGVAHRTVRTHLEKLFQEHGLQSRAAAVAWWLRGSSLLAERRPADECPFQKPFAADFDGCPAYQPRQATDLDLSYRPLGRTSTCWHLISRSIPDSNHRWYGACVIGDAGSRESWAAAVGLERLKRIGALRQELAAVSARSAESLWELKARQTQARRSGGDPTPATEAMSGMATRLLNEIGLFLEARQALLKDLHLPLEACMELIRVALQHLTEQDSVEFTWEIPDAVLARFPEDARLFLKPGPLPRPQPTASRSTDSQSGEASALDLLGALTALEPGLA
jgi:hypothetical protein